MPDTSTAILIAAGLIMVAGFTTVLAYRRISTVIFVPAQSGSVVEMVTIEPLSLQQAQEQDRQ